MTWHKRFASRFWALFRKRRLEQELDEELRLHLQMQTEDYIENGMTAQEARRAVRTSFGGMDQVKEDCRDRWSFLWIETLWRDVGYAVRSLLKTPGFTTVAMLSLALGIGGTTTIFSVLQTTVLRPLPFKNPDQLVMLWEGHSESGMIRDPMQSTIFEWGQAFDKVAVARPMGQPNTILIAGEALRATGQHVSAHLFQMLGVEPLLGRTFAAADVQQGYSQVVLISHEFWQRGFGGDPGILGKTFQNRQGGVRVVVGVMPKGFWVTPWTSKIDYWRAKPPFKASSTGGDNWWDVIARLKPGTNIEQARAHLDTISLRLAADDPAANEGWFAHVDPAHRMYGFGSMVSDVGAPKYAQGLYILLGTSGLPLLISCANLSGLLIGRAATRQSEIATRVALGAGRMRVARQLFTESVVLAVMGGLAGVALAHGGIQVFSFLAPEWHPYMNQVRLNHRVVAFGLGLSLFTAVLFGLIPAARAAAPNLIDFLKKGAGRSTGGPRQRGRSVLVVAQVAMASVLLIGTGLLLNSFIRLIRAPLGFNPNGLLTMEMSLGSGDSKYSHRQGPFLTITPQLTTFYEQVMEGLRSLPGVVSVGMISNLPTTNEFHRRSFSIVGQETRFADGEPRCEYHEVTDGFFQTMQMPLLEGRQFNERDIYESPWVVIVNQTLAKRYFPDESPVGKRIRPSVMRWWENAPPEVMAQITDDKRVRQIVGVVGDVKQDLRSEPIPVLYVPYRQHPHIYNLWNGSHTFTLDKDLVIRTQGEPTTFAHAARSIVSQVDPRELPSGVATMEERLSESIDAERFWLRMIGIFPASAFFLAVVGLYGVVSYSVSQRFHEFGIRMALGAPNSNVHSLVMKQGFALSLAGVALGVCSSLGLTRFIESQLYGVTTSDPVTYGVVCAALVGVTLVATYLPARRATRVDPMQVLRHE